MPPYILLGYTYKYNIVHIPLSGWYIFGINPQTKCVCIQLVRMPMYVCEEAIHTIKQAIWQK